MKVPSLEDMIQQEVNLGNYCCEKCHRPLREHHLVKEDDYFLASVSIYCYLDGNPKQVFKSKKDMSLTGMADTIDAMRREKLRQEEDESS